MPDYVNTIITALWSELLTGVTSRFTPSLLPTVVPECAVLMSSAVLTAQIRFVSCISETKVMVYVPCYNFR